jgi:hypothetical protein
MFIVVLYSYIYSPSPGPHFVAFDVSWFESHVQLNFGKTFEVMTLPPRHGFNRCDGHIGRLKQFIRELSKQGHHLVDARQITSAIVDHSGFENASEYAFDSIRTNILPPWNEIRRMTGITFCTHLVYTVLDKEGRLHVHATISRSK